MTMYTSILIPIAPDHNMDFNKILTVAKHMSGGVSDITVLTVVEDIPKYFARKLPPEFHNELIERTKIEMKEALGQHDGVKLIVKLGHSSSEILRYADKASIDCIVMASKRPELADIFLGSTATRVARRSNASIVIVR